MATAVGVGLGHTARYVRMSQLLVTVTRTAWHVDALWLPQAHAARTRPGPHWAQRAAVSVFLSGWNSYLQVRSAPPISPLTSTPSELAI
jgi:hypothetical protein